MIKYDYHQVLLKKFTRQFSPPKYSTRFCQKKSFLYNILIKFTRQVFIYSIIVGIGITYNLFVECLHTKNIYIYSIIVGIGITYNLFVECLHTKNIYIYSIIVGIGITYNLFVECLHTKKNICNR